LSFAGELQNNVRLRALECSGPLTFVAVAASNITTPDGKFHLSSTGADELVDDDLCSVCEITKLGLPTELRPSG